MQIRAEEISAIIKEKIKGFDKQVDVKETGSVIQVGDVLVHVVDDAVVKDQEQDEDSHSPRNDVQQGTSECRNQMHVVPRSVRAGSTFSQP